MPLTSALIRAAQHGNRTRYLYDGSGLILELAPTGAKWWCFKYRLYGKQKRLLLGASPVMSLAQAR